MPASDQAGTGDTVRPGDDVIRRERAIHCGRYDSSTVEGGYGSVLVGSGQNVFPQFQGMSKRFAQVREALPFEQAVLA